MGKNGIFLFWLRRLFLIMFTIFVFSDCVGEDEDWATFVFDFGCFLEGFDFLAVSSALISV